MTSLSFDRVLWRALAGTNGRFASDTRGTDIGPNWCVCVCVRVFESVHSGVTSTPSSLSLRVRPMSHLRFSRSVRLCGCTLRRNQTDMTDYDIFSSSLVFVGCLVKRKRTISGRLQNRLECRSRKATEHWLFPTTWTPSIARHFICV